MNLTTQGQGLPVAASFRSGQQAAVPICRSHRVAEVLSAGRYRLRDLENKTLTDVFDTLQLRAYRARVDAEELQADEIMGHRDRLHTEREFQVKWRGYARAQSTWEPRSELMRRCDDLVHAYENTPDAVARRVPKPKRRAVHVGDDLLVHPRQPTRQPSEYESDGKQQELLEPEQTGQNLQDRIYRTEFTDRLLKSPARNHLQNPEFSESTAHESTFYCNAVARLNFALLCCSVNGDGSCRRLLCSSTGQWHTPPREGCVLPCFAQGVTAIAAVVVSSWLYTRGEIAVIQPFAQSVGFCVASAVCCGAGGARVRPLVGIPVYYRVYLLRYRIACV